MTTERELIRELLSIVQDFATAGAARPYIDKQIAKADAYLATPEGLGTSGMPIGLHRAFVEGAKWWELDQTGATMWQSDQSRALEAAESKYGPRDQSAIT